jgi:hypothetical protein
MQSVVPTINYLKELTVAHLDLILEFSTWVLLQAPSEALNIFVVDRPSDKLLPLDRILAYLKVRIS